MKFLTQVCVRTLAINIGLLATLPLSAQSRTVNTSLRAVGYKLGTTSRVDLKAGELMPQAQGNAEVAAKKGVTNIKVSVTGLGAPTKLGAEFLTYVVWVVSPEGRASNIGEIQLDNSGKG